MVPMVYVGTSMVQLDQIPIDGHDTTGHPMAAFILPIREGFIKLQDLDPDPAYDMAISSLCKDLSVEYAANATQKEKVIALHTAFVNNVQVQSSNPFLKVQTTLQVEFQRKLQPVCASFISALEKLK